MSAYGLLLLLWSLVTVVVVLRALAAAPREAEAARDGVAAPPRATNRS